jgi:trehalose 6-phosphate synthase/phosphatase
MIWNNATDGRLERMQWEAYATVNQLYADFVSKIYQEGDISNVFKTILTMLIIH